MPRPHLLPGLIVALMLPLAARAAGPADRLFKLVPPDAGVTLAVEDLRGHARTLLASPLAGGLRRLPVVRKWQESEGFRSFRKSLDRIETLLGTDVATLRDEVLGEAVVLALWLPPGAGPDAARGLLLAGVPNRPLLDRLIDGLNAALTREGELKRIDARQRNGTTYHVREFKPGGRAAEYYAVFDDGVFAWSNSEALVHGAIDRKAAGPGLGDVPAFQEVRRRMPERSAISLFIDPEFAASVMAAAPRPEKPRDQRALEMFVRYLSALKYFGAALAWRDGPVIHAEELVDPSKLDPALTRWASKSAPADPRLTRIPASALGLATARVDFATLLDALKALTPDPERSNYDNLMLAIRGALLGMDPRDEVAPQLGPFVSVYLDRPAPAANDGSLRPPLVATIQVAATPEGVRAASALDNALRTLMALVALDPVVAAARVRVETRTEGGVVVTFLRGPKPFAFAVHEGRVVVASYPAAVGRALAAQADPRASVRFEALHARGVPRATTFALLDLRALYEFADPIRPAISRRLAPRQNRPEADAARDLDQALALIRLFDAAYFTTSIDPAFTGVHRALGLLARFPDQDQRP